MALRNIEDILPPLMLPIGEKEYRVPFLGIRDADLLRANIAPGTSDKPLSDEEFERLMLGPTYDEMVADNVPRTAVRLAAMTALADYQRGRVVAQVLWESDSDASEAPEVARRVVEELLAQQKLAEPKE